MEGNQGLVGRPFARNIHVKIKKSEITIEFPMSYLASPVPRTGARILNYIGLCLKFADFEFAC